MKLNEIPQGFGDGSLYNPIGKGFNHLQNHVKRGTPPRFAQQQPFSGYYNMPQFFMQAMPSGGNKAVDGIGLFGAPPDNGRFDNMNNFNNRGYPRRPYRMNNNHNVNHNNNNNGHYHNGHSNANSGNGTWNFSFKTDEELFCNNTPKGNINLELYDSIPVKQSGPDWTAVDPLTSFSDIKLHKVIMDNIERSQYIHPTPVQKYSLPITLAKRDLMACAQTGSGKTAAFLIPILHMMLENISKDSEKSDDVGSLSPSLFCMIILVFFYECFKDLVGDYLSNIGINSSNESSYKVFLTLNHFHVGIFCAHFQIFLPISKFLICSTLLEDQTSVIDLGCC